jgi:hypothetical protein
MKTRAVWAKEMWRFALMEENTKLQTRLLIDYAKREIQKIGDDISVAPYYNNLDRTGNLLDSLCWGVYLDGKVKSFGFYRPETAGESSALHEWSKPTGREVNGHVEAETFIATYNAAEKGWEVVFAVVAPYWGYWEKGFVIPSSGISFQWSVMTEHFDQVTDDLSPADIKFSVYIPD